MAKKSIEVKINKEGGKAISVGITCRHCDKPIVKSDFFGMFCEDNCGRVEAIEAYGKLKKVFPFL